MSGASIEGRRYIVDGINIDGERYIQIAVMNDQERLVTRDHFTVGEARTFAAEFIIAVEC